MRKKQLMALLFASMLAVSSIAGCGQKEPAKDTGTETVAEKEKTQETVPQEVEVKDLAPLTEAGVITGVADLKVAEGTDIDLNSLVYADGSIIESVDIDDSKVDYGTPGEYEVIYTITFDGERLRGFLKENKLEVSFDTDVVTITVRTIVTVTVMDSEEAEAAIEGGDKEVITNATKAYVQESFQAQAVSGAKQGTDLPKSDNTGSDSKNNSPTSSSGSSSGNKNDNSSGSNTGSSAGNTNTGNSSGSSGSSTNKNNHSSNSSSGNNNSSGSNTGSSSNSSSSGSSSNSGGSGSSSNSGNSGGSGNNNSSSGNANTGSSSGSSGNNTSTPVHKHSYSSRVFRAATCAEDGIKVYTCDCGKYYAEPIPATGNHNWVAQTETVWVDDGQKWVVDQAAWDEYIIVGYNFYDKCTGCGAHFPPNSNEGYEHLWECPHTIKMAASITTKQEAIWETIHHDEVGHYESTGHYEDKPTGHYTCSTCGKIK